MKLTVERTMVVLVFKTAENVRETFLDTNISFYFSRPGTNTATFLHPTPSRYYTHSKARPWAPTEGQQRVTQAKLKGLLTALQKLNTLLALVGKG